MNVSEVTTIHKRGIDGAAKCAKNGEPAPVLFAVLWKPKETTEKNVVKARKDGFELLLLGCGIFLVVGIAWGVLTSHPSVDFRPAYWSGRTFLHGGDPYDPAAVLREYHADGGDKLGDPSGDLFAISHSQYPPSELTFTAMFALLPFAVAQFLWIAVIAAGVIAAALLMWHEGARAAPFASGCLLAVFLANSPSLIAFGNPGCLAVSLCVIAVWCFLGERFIVAGIVCMAASLAIKPHDVGLVWLYFVLAGGANRRRALIALAVTAGISLPALVGIIHIAPHWVSEMLANVRAFAAHGGLNDPGPGTKGGRGIQMITDLQPIFSLFRDSPVFYNAADFIVCTPFLLAWVIAAVRSRGVSPPTENPESQPTQAKPGWGTPPRAHLGDQRRAWFCVAAIAALSMLPLYHRQYDAKLIMLAIPAFSMLLAAAGPMRRQALWITATVFVLNGDFTWLLLIHLIAKIPNGQVAQFLLVAPVPLSLLALGSFYLWASMRPAAKPAHAEEAVTAG